MAIARLFHVLYQCTISPEIANFSWLSNSNFRKILFMYIQKSTKTISK